VAGLTAFSQLFSTAWTYGTTVSIALTYCPAPTTTTLASGRWAHPRWFSPRSSPPPSNVLHRAGPSIPYFLYVSQNATSAGIRVYQRHSRHRCVPSTVLYNIFERAINERESLLLYVGIGTLRAVHPPDHTLLRSRPHFPSTTNTLVWTSNSFAGGQAIFCLMGTNSRSCLRWTVAKWMQPSRD